MQIRSEAYNNIIRCPATTKTYRLRWWLTFHTTIRSEGESPTITVYIVTRETHPLLHRLKSADGYNKPGRILSISVSIFFTIIHYLWPSERQVIIEELEMKAFRKDTACGRLWVFSHLIRWPREGGGWSPKQQDRSEPRSHCRSYQALPQEGFARAC